MIMMIMIMMIIIINTFCYRKKNSGYEIVTI